MFKYIVKRLALAILILLGVSLIIYVLIRCMPVSFIEGKIAEMNQGGATIPEETVESMKKLYGLEDDSFVGILKGYVNWLGKLVQFDFGTSFKYGSPVIEVIRDHMGVSFAIAFVAVILEFLIAIPLGITAATHQYSARDYIVTILVMIGISLPAFFFGQVLKDLFANKIGLFPPSGMTDASQSYTGFALLLDYLKHMFIPVLTVVILSIGGRMRMTRTNMLEVMNSDYIRTARAKGLKEKVVINKHAFRNTLIPLVTYMSYLLPSMFGGSMITETLFQIPGIGYISYQAITSGDIPFAMFYNLFLLILTQVSLIVADIMYAVVDPRVRIA